ncbi:MAG TPA: APC family permease [Actinomycetota bacterium]
MGVLKRVVLGRPIASEDAGHQLLPKLLALPVFASDALSSNAYATEEILLILIMAGTMHFGLSIPIAGAVAVLLAIVIVSYRQTVRAYPRGGGSYIVSRDNLGIMPGLVAAAALLVDYVLTVAVSIAAGSFAIASLIPSLLSHRVGLSLVFVAFIMVLNLRGLKESGTLFAVPTYGFVLSIFATLLVGLIRCTVASCPQVAGVEAVEVAVEPLTILLVLRAFSSGATALTGVEAIADGVAAFRGRRPVEQARNAAATLGMLAILSTSMFLGITILSSRMGAVPSHERSVVAQVADATFGGGAMFAVVQVMTALILVLAANTAYQDFPRLSSILAKDRFMPRQFFNRGDRLVFSNGILVLSILAGLLLVAFDADLNRLIQLYVVGVFTSFTLSQAGMVSRWRRLRQPETWRRRAILNGVGAATTGVVLIVVAVSKFTRGAWMVIVAIPLVVLLLRAISKHYAAVAAQLRTAEPAVPLRRVRSLVLVTAVDEATMRAVGYARSLRPTEVRAIHVGRDEGSLIRNAWAERRVPIELELIDGDPANLIDPIRSYVRALHHEPDESITIVLPEVVGRSRLRHYLQRRRLFLLKASLLFEPGVVLTDVTLPAEQAMTPTRGAVEPSRTIAVVLVSAVHNGSMRALQYARSLSPTDLRGVTFNIEPDETHKVLVDWGAAGADVPLEAVDSPFRSVTGALLRYVRTLRAQRPDAVVSVILPEFVVRRWWHQFLHNQTPLAIKAALLFEPGVVVTSVPYHLS